MVWKFETKVDRIEEDFAAHAIHNPDYTAHGAFGPHSYYTVEKRSLGWFAIIPEFGLRIRVGDTKPPDVSRGARVTLIIEDIVESETEE